MKDKDKMHGFMLKIYGMLKKLVTNWLFLLLKALHGLLFHLCQSKISIESQNWSRDYIL